MSNPLDEVLPYVAPRLHAGDGVQYHGSLTELHGLYRVLYVGADERLVLGRRGKTIISGVRRQSVTREFVCAICEENEIWQRAVMFGKRGDDCLQCAGHPLAGHPLAAQLHA